MALGAITPPARSIPHPTTTAERQSGMDISRLALIPLSGAAAGRLPQCRRCGYNPANPAPSHQDSQEFFDAMAIERTLSIIKPDATRRDLTCNINSTFEETGLRIVAHKRP